MEGLAETAGILRRKVPARESLLVEVDKETIAPLVEIGIDRNTIYEGSMLQVLDIFSNTLDQPEVFLYLDPPYPQDSRKSNDEASDDRHGYF